MLGMLIPLFNSFYVVSQVVQQQEKIIDILSLLTQRSQTESSQQHQPPSPRSPSLDSQQRPATVLNRQEDHDVIVLDQPESQIRKQPYTASQSGVRPVSRSLPFHKDPGLQGLLSSSRSFPRSGQETIPVYSNSVTSRPHTSGIPSPLPPDSDEDLQFSDVSDYADSLIDQPLPPPLDVRRRYTFDVDVGSSLPTCVSEYGSQDSDYVTSHSLTRSETHPTYSSMESDLEQSKCFHHLILQCFHQRAGVHWAYHLCSRQPV